MRFSLKIQRFIMFASSILIVIGLSLTVVFRYILKMDLFGMEDLLIIPVFCLYFFGATYGSYENSHISADILDTYVKNEKILLIIRTFTNIISIVASGIFSFWAFQYFLWSYDKMESTSGWHIPLFIPHGIVMIGFILMTMYMLIHLYNQVQQIRTGKVEEL